ncbi:hypothetical protein BROUX41_002631 [Berkeleyomyces rouxiae]|uniref:uncharacterized protein n=1 Tax=Berkeleyomyces rouxiae TaxID=2035830 RepID=UPI003B797C63
MTSSSVPTAAQPSRSRSPSLEAREPAPAADTATASLDGDSDGDAEPACLISLLLSSGARHAYKIDDRYLAKRGVDAEPAVPGAKRDPFGISVYTLKELVLREWHDEWGAKPASPSSIRLIYFGKLLVDKDSLRHSRFLPDTRNVVHMSIRPADVVPDDDEPKASPKSPTRSTMRPESTNCCVIL